MVLLATLRQTQSTDEPPPITSLANTIFTKNLNIPIQIQPQCFATLSLISWAQCLHYSSGWAVWSSSLLALGVAAACAGTEVALILTLRPIYDRGIEWPMLIVGITASILLAAGLIPPYFEIWKRRGRVVGIG